jgi:hypothetical protein
MENDIQFASLQTLMGRALKAKQFPLAIGVAWE